jgi:MFS family permease
MKLSTLMIVNAIVAAVFGLGFVFAPGQVTSLYSPEVGVTLRYVAQLFGAALLGFAVLTWVARNAPDSEARRAILLALFVGDGVGFLLALVGQLGGVVNALGWSTVLIYLLLALGFGYFGFVAKPELPRTHGQAL